MNAKTIPNVTPAPAEVAGRCQVKIVNHFTGRTTMTETSRDRSAVLFDLMRIVRRANRRRDETVRASLHVLRDSITVQWFCPVHNCEDLAREIVESVEPIWQVELAIRGGGPAT